MAASQNHSTSGVWIPLAMNLDFPASLHLTNKDNGKL